MKPSMSIGQSARKAGVGVETIRFHEIEQKIEQLQQPHAALETLIASCPGRGALQACSILDALTLHSDVQAGGRVEGKRTRPGQPRKRICR